MHLSPTSPDTAELVLDELRRLVQGLRASSHTIERTLGISGAQLFVLRALADEPGASIRRVSERTLTDPSSVSTVVSRLVERGLVQRTKSELDARATSLKVTKRGATLLARAPEPYQARIIEALRGLPAKQLHGFHRSLAQIVDALHIDRTTAPLFFESDAPKRRARRAPAA